MMFHQYAEIPPWLPILLSSLIHHVSLFSYKYKKMKMEKTNSENNVNANVVRLDLIPFFVMDYIAPAILLFFLSPPHPHPHPHSSAYLLRPMFVLLRQWPRLFKPMTLQKYFPNWGPLGFGYGKVCEVVCAWFLLSYSFKSNKSFHDDANTDANTDAYADANTDAYADANTDAYVYGGDGTDPTVGSMPKPLQLGPLPKLTILMLVLLMSMLVNHALSLWSNIQKSRGDHSEVNAMVESSIGRSLTLKEHIKILSLAVLNAVCEEVVSRGFFMYEFLHVGHTSTWGANLGQAIAFGIWHYHGIPSGITGVLLTFVYGLMMGWLYEYGGGLFLPILAHSIADYFIFSVIVRRKELVKKQ